MKAPFPDYKPGKKGDETSDAAVAGVDPPHIFDDAPPEEPAQYARLRDVPFRMLVPNLITLGAICSGLTAVRLAFEGRFQLAIVAIVFAACLDALDGRVARFLKSTSSFGEQMDSLADFVNFGVAPALVLYLWTLRDAQSLGWIAALIFAICGCLRLARFNVTLDSEDKRDWEVDFFVGVPAPAGAILVMLPIYLGLLGFLERFDAIVTWATLAYVLFIGFLMTSSLPTWSGKRSVQRISRHLVVPVMIGLMLLIVFLFSYPWLLLTIGALAYLATIPFSIRDWRRRDASESSQEAPAP
ncbi:MAG: CDP-diacylglycerol--serine O-phosphatidyltransferase [Ahrensia sp.]|nr:CDP-diacylglycerol--serine O-phosphatidyltransferase [Ahrensia sp.]